MNIKYYSILVQQIADHVEQEMKNLCIAHDFYHILRVVRMAQIIQEQEGGDKEIIELGALLHEYFDDKFYARELIPERKNQLKKVFQSYGANEEKIKQILFIVENVGYGKSLERTTDFIGSLEFQIVEDADRLEAIGAIAIARTFAYGSVKGHSLYDPDIVPNMTMDRATYSKKEGTSLNHFYEKLFLLKDIMHTTTGKMIAQPRHDFMQGFVDQFLKERNCEI